mgnify:CR=1 FL=1
MFHLRLKKRIAALERICKRQAVKIKALEKRLQNIESWIDGFIESKTQEAKDEKQCLESLSANLQHLPENIRCFVDWPQYDYSKVKCSQKKEHFLEEREK